MRMRMRMMARLVVVIAALAAGLVAAGIGARTAQRPSQGVSPTTGGWQIVVLGIAQDAGIPQLGCEQDLCRSIREGKRKPERVASIGLVNRELGLSYLFDATPDMVSQLGTLNGGRVPTGVFLTHAHIGHYTGLMYFGRESLNATSVPVHGTARMAAFLTANGPWNQLVSLENIEPRVIAADRPVDLPGGIRVTAFPVPHRDEFTDTVGYLIERAGRKALFIPDIDQWGKWSRNVRALVDTVDLAFLDGTFASAGELPGRSIADIPHPLIPATRKVLTGTRAKVWFIHLNHTNAELTATDVVRDGMTFVF
jgi:pyrroloquinoline quinone biosynthesis protein B